MAKPSLADMQTSLDPDDQAGEATGLPARQKELPLVYSCSGCSSAAQMANHLAIALDRRGLAEMSCIAGVGGDVPKLVRVATSGRPIIGIDGCALACVRQCLARHGVTPTEYHLLSDLGVRKRYRTDFDPEEAETVLEKIAASLASARQV